MSISLLPLTATGAGTLLDFEGKRSFTSYAERKHLIQGSQMVVAMFLLSLAVLDEPQHEVYPSNGLLAKTRDSSTTWEQTCVPTEHWIPMLQIAASSEESLFSCLPSIACSHSGGAHHKSFSLASAWKGKLFIEKGRRVSQRLEDSFAVCLVIKHISPVCNQLT